jgi:hypothetical protein
VYRRAKITALSIKKPLHRVKAAEYSCAGVFHALTRVRTNLNPKGTIFVFPRPERSLLPEWFTILISQKKEIQSSGRKKLPQSQRLAGAKKQREEGKRE